MTVPQHMAALAKANEVRLARADLRRRIGAGEVSVRQVLGAVPAEAVSMTVFDLLVAQRRWGVQRARRLLRLVAVSEAKRVGELTPRQRSWICELLGADKARLRRAEEDREIADWAARVNRRAA